jgi:phosphate transport system substrate-binding protein
MYILNRRLIASVLAAIGLAALTLTPAAAAVQHVRPATVTINGSGSSFDNPLYSAWSAHYGAAHVNYQSLGSGTGQTQLNAGLTDFGAFDVPMLSTDGFSNFSKITQFPITLGGVAIEYNLPDYTAGSLKLTGPLVCAIYEGQITKWTDKALTKLDPGLKHLKGQLDEKITVVHRSDSSGTTYIFTDWLSHTCGSWKSKYGASKLPAWPAGVGGGHSTGVDSLVNSTKGSIGYVEVTYALQNHKTPAYIENKAKQYLQPSLKGVAADAAEVKKITTTSFSIVNQKGKKSYPISGFSWSGVYAKGSDWSHGTTVCRATVAFFKWATTTGQGKTYTAAPNYYVPLPKKEAAYAKSQLKKVKC